jgi:hypothetical protein
MKAKHLFEALTLSLGLMLALLAGLQRAQATPAAANLFVKPGGTGSTCTQMMPCALQTALSQAVDGDTIYVAGGNYTGKGTHDMPVISVTQSITLYGGWDGAAFGPIVRDPAAHPSVLDGERMRRVVHIRLAAPTLDGFVIANGNATGLVGNCYQTNADGCGGGVFVQGARPVIVNNVITNNIAAVTTVGYPTGTTGYGGGLYLYDVAGAVISGNLIISNVASLANCGEGGGIYLQSYGTNNGAQLLFNQVLSNTATTMNLACGLGGGISGGPYGALIQGNTIAGNQANSFGGGYGAGLYQWYGTAAYLNNLVRGNLGSVSGQAVYLGWSESDFVGNRVVDNATSQGIRLEMAQDGGPRLVNNVVARSGDKTLSTFGGMSYPLTATLLHNTLVGSGSGSGVYVETDYVALFLTNTIVVSHTWGITSAFPASSTVLADHTLFWANIHDGIRGVNPVDGNPTFAADGYHIGPGSAVDAGVNAGVITDIDGDPRPDGCFPDIGADELVTGLGCWRVHLPLVLRN